MKRLEKNYSKSLYLYLIRANFKDKKPFQSSYGIVLESIIKKGLETLKVKILLKGHYITMGLGQSYNMYQTSCLQKKSNFFIELAMFSLGPSMEVFKAIMEKQNTRNRKIYRYHL